MRKFLYVLVIGALLLASLSFTPASAAPAACGAQYTVQRGDTLSGIAQKCGLSLAELLQANPQISNARLIYAGMSINIPGAIIPDTGAQAKVQISPPNGLPGTQVTVRGGGFPAGSAVRVALGLSGQAPVSTTRATPDDSGNFTTRVTIPNSAQAGSVWTITATSQSTEGTSASAAFQVISSPPSGSYIVVRGDTLSSIARRFGTTVNALLRANPQISDANELSPGDALYIPGSTVVINGQPTYIVRQGDSMSMIAFRLGITLDSLIQLNPQIANPRVIYPGQRINLPGGIIPITGATPQVQISPLNGGPGTTVTVVGSGFPARAQVIVTASLSGQAPEVAVSVTADNQGDFTARLTIPNDADAGSTWIISAATVSASAQFQVTTEPTSGTYTVQAGDTLSKLARRFGLPLSLLTRANPQISNPSRLTVGQVINIPARISFAAGTTSAVETGSLAANASDYYVFRAAANQTLEVNVSGQGFQLAIYGANGAALMRSTEGAASFRGRLPASQDYLIVVTTSQAGNYSLNMAIPARISFATGATSGTVTGSLAAHASQYYILRARANQQMRVDVSPADALQLVIYGVDGDVLKSGMGGGSSFRGTLPSTQDYILVLTAGDAAVDYSMTVRIPR